MLLLVESLAITRSVRVPLRLAQPFPEVEEEVVGSASSLIVNPRLVSRLN